MNEVVAYVDRTANIAKMMKDKKPTTGMVFVSPPGYMYFPRAI